MVILLDTNVLIWLIDQKDSRSIGQRAKKLLGSASVVYASPISIFEIRIKTMLGKLESQQELLDDIQKSGLQMLDFSAEQAECVQDFPELVRHDPFDRMLLAQAQAENLTFLTSDKSLLDLGLGYVVDATC